MRSMTPSGRGQPEVFSEAIQEGYILGRYEIAAKLRQNPVLANGACKHALPIDAAHRSRMRVPSPLCYS